MRNLKLSVILLFLLCFQAFGQTNVILMSWDGADRSVVSELLKSGTLTNMALLIKAGSFQNIDVKGHETETLPGHAEMLTGMSADKTGVEANHNTYPVPKGLSIFEHLKKEGAKDNISTIMVTGKSKIPRMMSNSKASVDETDAGDRVASKTGVAALAALDKHAQDRFFAFIHFSDPDFAGHGNGSDSQEYLQAIVTCDSWLGRINAWLKEHKMEGHTLIYITADHGFDKNARGHSNAPDVWLATNDKGVKHGGILADIPATILDRFGINFEKLDPPLLGKPLTGAK